MLPENKSQLYAYRWLEYSSLTSLAIRQQRGLYTIAQMAEILVGIAVFSVGFEMLLAAQWRQGNGGARTKRGESPSTRQARQSIQPERLLWRVRGAFSKHGASRS